MVSGPFTEWISDSLADMLKADEGESVVYRRGANTVTIQAVHPQKSDDIVDESGVVVTVRSRDFILFSADLVLNGLVEKPKRGDTIEWDGGVYEVLPVDGSTLWEWWDSHHKQIIIHTQEVKAS